MDLDDGFGRAIAEAREYREQARTYSTRVGVAVETFDGEVFGGFNMENKRHKGVHAEEAALIHAMLHGYNATDLRSLVVVYADSSGHNSGIFPACLSCLAFAWDYAHPKLNVVVADTDGELLYHERLDAVVEHPGEADTFPTHDISGRDELDNGAPRLPLHPELHDFYEQDPSFREFCETVGVEIPDGLVRGQR